MKETYYYDEEKCAYIKEERNWKYYLKHGTYWSLSVLGISVVIIAITLYFFDGKTVKHLQKEKEILTQSSLQFEQEIQRLRLKLDSIKKQDTNLYRLILNAEPVAEKIDTQATNSPPLDTLNMEVILDKIKKVDKMLDQTQQIQASLMAITQNSKEGLKRIPAIRPVASEIISGFGKRKNPVTGGHKFHTGVDFKADIGTKVLATADAIVKEIGTSTSGQGLYIILSHGYGFESKYAALSKVLVHRGQVVKRGEVIALSGNSGLSKGPHLHYEVIKNGRPLDPIDYFYMDLTPEKFLEFKKNAQQFNESMD
ncbi:MAG: peptidoglycan DD-metalloendopeptidase family protein [Bacteroidia bacterium]|nr:peptidoglycan DD-metalloendopeptidase family protein [Bacteroidia bacterium]MDW8157544.1 peptidoglycan DD-metalloendopeptidase family protein [Bacteroidia bacterium]